MATTPRPSSHAAAASCLIIIAAAAITLFTATSTISAREIFTNRSCIPAERAALLSFKAGITGDPANRLGSWHGHDCCHWSGVRCSNRTGHVVKLHLRNGFLLEDYYLTDWPDEAHSLRGQVSSSLLALPHLRHLDLSGNIFLGDEMAIPGFMGSLERLTYLNLSYMGFGGRVPPQLGNLSKLIYLDISYNINSDGLYSKDIYWLARLHSLEHLDLGDMNLSTVVDWVHTVNTLHNLVVLNLEFCILNGSTPSLPHHNLTVLEELDLSGNDLNNPAAPNWFWGVPSLRSISLSVCQLSGKFPDELGNLTLLENLHMGYNNIEGMIPATLKNLCNLRILDLEYNNIGGDITDLIERLPNCSWKNLQKLYLSGANITGTTLKSVINLSSLNMLDVSHNHLSGSVPVEIGTLSNLTGLYLTNNSLSGVISEDHFAGLTNLKDIDLSHNYLELIVESDWVAPFNLHTTSLASCHLGPGFPNWLRWQKGIQELDISNTGLVGRIPDWFWTTFSDAEVLDISSNQLSGELPVNLEFMSVRILSLQSNRLTGPIPLLPRKVQVLDISGNYLNGFVSNIRAPYLQVAVLFSNFIAGTIPTSICEWPELRVLDLSNNLLTGDLPHCSRKDLKQRYQSSNNTRVDFTISSGLKIDTLLLGDNSLSGGFPLFLRQCQNLVFLDLAQNEFSGKLPAWVSEDMPALAILRLRSNNFSGHIPIEITRLLALRIIDLSNNNFSGAIPQSLENLKALKGTSYDFQYRYDPFREGFEIHGIYVTVAQSNESLSVVIKGQVLDYRETIYLRSIDLSGNRLTGEIPEELSSLVGLTNLNLSSNLLSGNIPYKIGNLRSLESLDLSENQLAGEIPWGLSDLTSLNYLNLSYNNLSGRIPSGHQLDTLNTDNPSSMYIGNPGLCGHPIPKQCPGDQPTHEDSIRWDEDGISQMDFLLGLIVGFVAGVWMVFCGLLLMKRWRYAYFGLFDKLYDRFYVICVVARRKWFRNTGVN